jgi:hypothetical protein
MSSNVLDSTEKFHTIFKTAEGHAMAVRILIVDDNPAFVDHSAPASSRSKIGNCALRRVTA